eukprot:2963520-Rhodomonas_salina.1
MLTCVHPDPRSCMRGRKTRRNGCLLTLRAYGLRKTMTTSRSSDSRARQCTASSCKGGARAGWRGPYRNWRKAVCAVLIAPQGTLQCRAKSGTDGVLWGVCLLGG